MLNDQMPGYGYDIALMKLPPMVFVNRNQGINFAIIYHQVVDEIEPVCLCVCVCVCVRVRVSSLAQWYGGVGLPTQEL